MRVVKMMSVIYIVEGNTRRHQDVKICWMGLSQQRCCINGVNEDRSAPHDTVAQAMQDLVSWWVLEVAARKLESALDCQLVR